MSLKFARNKSPRQVDSFLDGRIPFILTALLENQFTRFFSKKALALVVAGMFCMAGAWGAIYGYYGNQLYEYIGDETSIELISTDMTMGNWAQSNAYDFTLTGTIASSDTIIVASGQTLKLQNGWTNEGTIVNYGTVDTTGTFTNSGTITNTISGTFISENGLTNSGVINNYGTIELKSEPATNNGTVTNYEGSTTTGAVTWTGTSPTTAPSDPVVVTDFATYYWSGAGDGSTWTDSANWQYKGLQGTSEAYVSVAASVDDAGNSCAGRYPGSEDGDEAVFQGSVTVDVSDIKFAGTGYTLTIESNSSRRVAIKDCSTNSDSANIILTGSSTLIFNGCKFGSVTVSDGAEARLIHGGTETISLEVQDLIIEENGNMWGNDGARLDVLGDLTLSGTLGDNSSGKIKTLNVAGNTSISTSGKINLSVADMTFSGPVANEGSLAGTSATLTLKGGYSGSGSFTASSGSTYFLSDVDFSDSSYFNPNGGIIYFYNTATDDSELILKTPNADTDFNEFYFGGNLVVAVTNTFACTKFYMSAVGAEYQQTKDFTVRITGSSPMTVGNTELDRCNADGASTVTGTLSVENTSFSFSNSFGLHSGTNLLVGDGSSESTVSLSAFTDYSTADRGNSITVKNKGRLNAVTLGFASNTTLTVELGGTLEASGNITSAAGNTTSVINYGNLTASDILGPNSVQSVQNMAGGNLVISNALLEAQDIFNGGTIKTKSLTVKGSIDSCKENTVSLIDFTGDGTLSVGTMSSSTITNVKIDSGVTLTLGSEIVFSGNVENDGTVNAGSNPFSLKGTSETLSEISGSGTFVVDSDNFSGEYLSIGSAVTICETAGSVQNGSHKAYVGTDKTSIPLAGTADSDYFTLFKNGWDLGYEFTYTWKGTNSAWSTDSNWEPELAPGISAKNTVGAKVLIPDGCSAWPQIYTAQIELKSLTIGTESNSTHDAKIILNVDGSGSPGGGYLNIENTDASLPLLTNYGTIEYKGLSRITNGSSPLNDPANGGSVKYSGTGQTVTQFSSTGASYANLVISGTGAMTSDDVTVSGNISLESGSSFQVGGNKSLIILGNLTDKGSLTSGINAKVELGGNLFVDGTGSLTSKSGSTLLFNGSTSTQIITVASSASLQLANLEIASSASVTTSGSFTVSENWTNENASGSGFVATLGTITFSGDASVSGQNTFYEATFTGDAVISGKNTFSEALFSKNDGNVHIADENTFKSLKFTGEGMTVKFAAGKTQTVTDSLSSKGTSASKITLTTDAASPSVTDESTWWILDIPSDKGKAIAETDFVNTNISYSKSLYDIIHQWAASVDEGEEDSSVNWFSRIYYWLGGSDESIGSKWETDGNWRHKDEGGSYYGVRKWPTYEAPRNTIYIETEAGAKDLVLENNVSVKKIIVESGKVIDLKRFTLSADDSDSATADFINQGTVRLYGLENQIDSSHSDGEESLIEYYVEDSATSSKLVWGSSYVNLAIEGSFTVSEDISVSNNLKFGQSGSYGASGSVSSKFTVAGLTSVENGSGNILSLTGKNVFTGLVSIGDSANSLSGGKIILNSDGNLRLAEVNCDSLEVQSSVEFTEDVVSPVTFSGSASQINGGGKTFSAAVTFSGAEANLSGNNAFSASATFTANTNILGNNTFSDFVCKTAETKISFAGGTHQAVSGNLTLKGSSSSHIEITGESEWEIEPADVSKVSLAFVTVKNSKNTATDPIIVYAKGGYNTDGTGNTNWIFAGQEYVWTGADPVLPTEWNQAANWSPSSVPGRYADVTINSVSSNNYPVLTSDLNLDKGSVSFALDDDGDGSSDRTESVSSVLTIGEGGVFDFNGKNPSINTLYNSGRIRVRGSELFYSALSGDSQGIENFPLDSDSYITGEIEYYDDFSTALNWGNYGNKYKHLEFTSGAKGSDSRPVFVKDQLLICNGSANEISLTGNNVFENGAKIVSSGIIELAGSSSSGEALSLFGDDNSVISCDSLKIHSPAKFDSDIILEIQAASFAAALSGAGVIDFRGDFASFGSGNVVVTASYLLASGSSSRTLQALDSSSLTFDCDVFVNLDSAASLEIASALTWKQVFCAYSGRILCGSVSLSGKELLLFGSSYSADDSRYSGNDSRFSYYGYDSLAYKPGEGSGAFKSELSSSGTKITLSGNFYANGLALSGLSLVLPDQSSSKPLFNATSLVTENQWGNPYAVVFNSSISSCSAGAESGSAFVASSLYQNNTDSGSNSGFQFDIPQISQCYSVTDAVLCLIFDMALENSNKEVSSAIALTSALESGGIFYNGKKLAFDGVFYTESDGDDCSLPLLESAYASQDIPALMPLYLKVSQYQNTWNTDATGSSAGDSESTNRSGLHCEVSTDISFFEGLFYAADGKTMCRNYGSGLWQKSDGTYDTAESFISIDKARPVLIEVSTGQELHVKNSGNASSQKLYDSHNFIEFRYSEPVDIGNLAASGSETLQAEKLFDSAEKHGGAISDTAAGISVTGFGSFEKGELTAGIKTFSGSGYTGSIDTALPHSLYRTFSLTASEAEKNHPHRLRISVAGYVDQENPVTVKGQEFNNWLGYIDSSLTPSGIFTPAENLFITDLASDGEGNALKNPLDPTNSSLAITVNSVLSSESTSASLYGEWDCLPPVFATYVTTFDESSSSETSWTNGDSDSRQYEMIGYVDSNTNAYIDKIEMHLFDNQQDYLSTDSYKWASRKGWVEGSSASLIEGYSAPESSGGSRGIPSSAAMTYGGIRRSSLENAYEAFTYVYSVDGSDSEERSFSQESITQNVKSSLFRSTDLSETFTESDGPYLGININPEDSRLPIRTSFTVTYRPEKSFITDLAGNRLIQTDSGSDKKVLHTIDITPPSFTMTISPVGQNKIYAAFTKPLAFKGVSLYDMSQSQLAEVLEKISSNLEFVYSEENNVDTSAVDSSISVLSAELVSKTSTFTALLFTLDRKITLTDVENLWLRVNEEGEDWETVFGTIKASYIQDIYGNPASSHTCHAISDFAVNAVNVLYAYADSQDGDGWDEHEIYGQGLAPESSDYALHDFSDDGDNYGRIRSGRDIVFQLEFLDSDSGSEKSGVANGESLALVYDEKSNIRSSWLGDKYNLLSGSDWRVWLDEPFDSFASGFNSNPLSAGLGESDLFSAVSGSDILQNMIWKNDIFNLSAGSEYQFLFKILDSGGNEVKINHDGDKRTAPIPLYALRMPAERINAGDFSFVDLWSFTVSDITRQRGGVTILNNVINAAIGEKTAVEVNMASEGNLNVYVLTLDGNVVKRLVKGKVSAGSHYYYWDGKNNGGKPVARGMYFIRVSGSGIDETRKVMVVK